MIVKVKLNANGQAVVKFGDAFRPFAQAFKQAAAVKDKNKKYIKEAV